MNAIQRKVIDLVQPHVGEPVIAAGYFSNAALMDAAFEPRLTAKKEAGGLPMNVILAVTRDRIHVLSFGSRWFKQVIKEELTAWDRAGLQVSTVQGTMARRVTLEWPASGRRVELDANKPDRGDLASFVIAQLAGD